MRFGTNAIDISFTFNVLWDSLDRSLAQECLIVPTLTTVEDTHIYLVQNTFISKICITLNHTQRFISYYFNSIVVMRFCFTFNPFLLLLWHHHLTGTNIPTIWFGFKVLLQHYKLIYSIEESLQSNYIIA